MKFKRSISLILSLVILNFFSANSYANECDGLLWSQTLLENKEKHYETSFLEERNDIGIFFDFQWNSELQKTEIKRDKYNYPIIRFSLFDKKNIQNGSIIKSLDKKDLSKLNDREIKNIKFYSQSVEAEIENNKKILFSVKPYKLIILN